MKVTPLLFDTYMAAIQGAVGSKMFNRAYALVDGKKKEVTEKGNLSCALFPSFVLKYFDLIKEGHFTVSGLVRDLEASGWKKIRKPKTGCILVWSAQDDKKDKNYSFGHRHIGFSIGQAKAISNLSSKGKPGIHHWTFGMKKGKPVRKVEAMYWHEKLGTRR